MERAMSDATKFRPVHWSDIHKIGAPIVGWGIERKLPTERPYTPVGYHGSIHPFQTKAEAQKVCDELMTKEDQ